MNIIDARDNLTVNMNWIKAKIFNSDPDSPVILHRTDIMNFKREFQILRDDATREFFDSCLMRMFKSAPFTLITALIDKNWMLRQHHWKQKEPYHFLMEIMVEKYTQFLERQNDIGDIMPEGRGRQDKRLQQAFTDVKTEGTQFVPPERIQSRIRADKLKFRRKYENISGLQLCDLVAHPSHMYARQLMGHNVDIRGFTANLLPLLRAEKYDRSLWGRIRGYGVKTLP